jgi:hypothetical protein
MNDELIDKAIFSVLSESLGHWRKVAFVVGSVANSMGDVSAYGDEGYETIARRIELLVSEGRLLAQGNIKNWRFSEVRLPN